MKTYNVEVFLNDDHVYTFWNVMATDAEEARWRIEENIYIDYSVEEND